MLNHCEAAAKKSALLENIVTGVLFKSAERQRCGTGEHHKNVFTIIGVQNCEA